HSPDRAATDRRVIAVVQSGPHPTPLRIFSFAFFRFFRLNSPSSSRLFLPRRQDVAALSHGNGMDGGGFHLARVSQLCYTSWSMKKAKTTADAVRAIHRRYIGDSKKRRESLQRERENLTIAEQVYNLRTQAKL